MKTKERDEYTTLNAFELGDKVELIKLATEENMNGYGGFTKCFEQLEVGDVGIVTANLMNGTIDVMFDKLYPEVGYSISFRYPISIFKKVQS